MSIRYDYTCQLVGKGTVRIIVYDETMKELKEVRYIPHKKKNLILIGALQAKSLRGTLGEGVLKMSSGSLVVLEGQ